MLPKRALIIDESIVTNLPNRMTEVTFKPLVI